jgi:hypothetical protein
LVGRTPWSAADVPIGLPVPRMMPMPMTVTQRLDRHDKQIRDLMKEGIKMVAETRRLAPILFT